MLLLVWPLPRSLATTSGISFDFSSSPYLDVSVQAVPLIQLWIHCMIHRRYPMWIAPFGHLRINACLQLPAAFRSLPRPSSAPSAKASALCSFSLDLLLVFSVCCCVAARSLFSHIPQYAPSSFTHAPCISSENPAQTFSCLLPSSFISVASVNNLLS